MHLRAAWDVGKKRKGVLGGQWVAPVPTLAVLLVPQGESQSELNLYSLQLNCCIGFVWQDFGSKKGIQAWGWNLEAAQGVPMGFPLTAILSCSSFSRGTCTSQTGTHKILIPCLVWDWGLQGFPAMVLSGFIQLCVGLVFPTVKWKHFLFCLSPKDERTGRWWGGSQQKQWGTNMDLKILSWLRSHQGLYKQDKVWPIPRTARINRGQPWNV